MRFRTAAALCGALILTCGPSGAQVAIVHAPVYAFAARAIAGANHTIASAGKAARVGDVRERAFVGTDPNRVHFTPWGIEVGRGEGQPVARV